MSRPRRRRVAILAGGLSHEREVSLRSGRRVLEALTAAGVEACVRDVDATLLEWLEHERPDCVVPLLHGEAGEGGALQEVLTLAGTPYVGSTPQAARVAFDKPAAKHMVGAAGVATPDSVVLPAHQVREIGAPVLLAAVVARLGLPLMVKPARGGSALGCSKVDRADDLAAALRSCYSYGSTALVERFVRGTEVAVPVLALEIGKRALPVVEIRPDGGVYDYSARYQPGTTEFVVPADLPEGLLAECARVATASHLALGLGDLSRVDLIVDDAGTVQFLEVNVSPGMTETSLVPLSIRALGTTVGAVLSDLVEGAVSREKSIQR